MSLTVVWMRHAKSSWDAPVTDERRELAERGRRNAATAGELLRDRGVAFDLVLHSPAERARETWQYIAEAGVPATEVREEVTLYEGDASDIVTLVADTGAQTVLVIGHAPAIPEAVERSARRESTKTWAAFDIKFPTAAMAVVEAVSTDDLRTGKGTLVDFVVPR